MALDSREFTHKLPSKYNILATPPKALTFDVFDTVVNWRHTVTEVLVDSAAKKSLKPAKLSPEARTKLLGLKTEDWGRFA